MTQNTKTVQILSKAEAKILVNRSEARYLGRATFSHEVIFCSMAETAESSDLERTALQEFARQHRADILVQVNDRSRYGNVSDCISKTYDFYKLNKSQMEVY
jgi:hypothetical protein